MPTGRSLDKNAGENTTLDRTQILSNKSHGSHECLWYLFSPKDTSLIRAELFARRGVPIRGGGPLYCWEGVWVSFSDLRVRTTLDMVSRVVITRRSENKISLFKYWTMNIIKEWKRHHVLTLEYHEINMVYLLWSNHEIDMVYLLWSNHEIDMVYILWSTMKPTWCTYSGVPWNQHGCPRIYICICVNLFSPLREDFARHFSG